LRTIRIPALVVLTCLLGALSARAQAPAPAPQGPDGVDRLLNRLEQIVLTGDIVAYLDLVSGSANRGRATDFTRSEIQSGATRAVVKERERIPFGNTIQPSGYRVIADVFVEYGSMGRVATWQLDLQRRDDGFQIFDQQRLTSVERLFRLSLDADHQFAAQNLAIHAEDFDLTFDAGSVFLSSVDAGVTGVVLLGRGDMHFHPKPDTEKTQVRIFSGSERLDTPFTSAFLRMDPADFERFIDVGALKTVPADPREFKRADEVFTQDFRKSYHLNLGDLSGEPWSLLPGTNNFVAEVHTRRHGILTYARSKSEAEDITLFDRIRHRNIAVYSSAETLERRGRSYNEDDFREYDVIDYNLEVALSPGRQWIDGVTTVTLRVKAPVVTSITLRLADALVVRSITSDTFGRLFGFRVNNQNLVVINLPAPVGADSTLKLTLAYGGRVEPQLADGNETIGVGQDQGPLDASEFTAEPSFLYSTRLAWYPQGTTSDYATARMKISVPPEYGCIASGVLDEGWPKIFGAKADQSERRVYSFASQEPLRYLAFIVSRFEHVETTTLEFPEFGKSLTLSVEAHPRQTRRGRELARRAADIATFYASLAGDVPYPAFTLAVVEGELPGGHSPAYFAELLTPLPMTVQTWRNDPASFDRFPDFFLAHELAHQWFGQAVGWGNYHEQWLSEAFAQYFAALYAQHSRGDGVFGGVLRQMRRWAVSQSDQGPVYLGYRLGHIKSDGRIFRALVYNKGAAVLHMLRRLIGDEAFFKGLRRFYASAKFRKAGTDELKSAFEVEAGRSLDRFFEQWIYGSTLPRLKVSYKVEGSELAVHVEQIGEVFEVPVSFSVDYDDRRKTNIVVAVSEQTVDRRIPLPARPRSVSINKDDGTLAEFAN
jgi:Peptidase family M1 domain